jgi:hypothetical protein
MSTYPSLETSPLTSKQEYYSSLPWFRRCLAMLNWRPVVDYELREIEFDRKDQQLRIEEYRRQTAHEQRMRQLKKESEQLESEIARLDALNSKIDTLFSSSSTSSIPPQNISDNSEA